MYLSKTRNSARFAVLAAALVLVPVSDAYAKNDALKGAVVGAGVGALVGGSDGAAAGALVGAIAGSR